MVLSLHLWGVAGKFVVDVVAVVVVDDFDEVVVEEVLVDVELVIVELVDTVVVVVDVDVVSQPLHVLSH